MLVSAKTKSTVVAVLVPFILIFIPSFLSGITLKGVEKILGLLPDQLLQMNVILVTFHLYTIGEKVYGSVGILLLAYAVLSLPLCFLLYQSYKKAEVSNND